MTRVRHYLESIQKLALKHQLIVLLIGSIILSLALTVLSVSLYVRSGAQELDLSRPGYESVRDEVAEDERNDPEFSPQGDLTAEDINQFRELYNTQREKLDGISDYDDEALSDEALRLFE